MKLFSGAQRLIGKKPPPIDPNESMQSLRSALELLETRETHLDQRCNEQLSEARTKIAAKNKRGAMICLKRKKGYEAQMLKLSGARMTLEQQIMTIESSRLNMEAMSAMQLGAKTMQTLHKNMDIEDVDDTVMDIQEQMDISNQISDAISQPLMDDQLDEDDLNAELDMLEQETLDEQLFGLEQRTAMPQAPSGELTATGTTTTSTPAEITAAMTSPPTLTPEEEEAEALRQLEAEMAI